MCGCGEGGEASKSGGFLKLLVEVPKGELCLVGDAACGILQELGGLEGHFRGGEREYMD